MRVTWNDISFVVPAGMEPAEGVDSFELTRLTNTSGTQRLCGLIVTPPRPGQGRRCRLCL